MSELIDCPQCGDPTIEFVDGVCGDCAGKNQSEITLHDLDCYRWSRLSEKERDEEIRRELQ